MDKSVYLVCEYDNGEIEHRIEEGKSIPNIVYFIDETKARLFMRKKNKQLSANTETRYRLLKATLDLKTGIQKDIDFIDED